MDKTDVTTTAFNLSDKYHDMGRTRSNTKKIGYIPDSLTQQEFSCINDFIHGLHAVTKEKGDSFQIMDLLLSDVMYRSSNHQSWSSTSLICSSVYLYKKNKRTLEKEVSRNNKNLLDYHHKTISEIDKNIEGLLEANVEYLTNDDDLDVSSKDKYEYFRYFLLRTVLSNIAFPERYGFYKNGIHDFFKKIMVSPRTRTLKAKKIRTTPFLSVMKTNHQEKAIVERVAREIYLKGKSQKDLESEVVLLKESNEIKEALVVKEFVDLFKNMDVLCGLVLQSRTLMQFPCYQIFFGFSHNIYYPWASSVTLSAHEDDYLILEEVLKNERGKLIKSISYSSYIHYLNGMKTQLLTKKEGESESGLGVMIIKKFDIAINSNFHIGGVFRCINKVRINSCGEFVTISDEYSSDDFSADKDFLEAATNYIKYQLKTNLGKEDSFFKLTTDESSTIKNIIEN